MTDSNTLELSPLHKEKMPKIRDRLLPLCLNVNIMLNPSILHLNWFCQALKMKDLQYTT